VPEGFRVASAWVEVKPDTEGFKEELQATLDEATAGTAASARISLDTAEFDARLDDARARLDEFSGSRAEPSLHLNDEELGAGVDEARARLDELDAKSARPEVGLGTGDLDARIDEARARLDELDQRASAPRLSLDTAEFDAKMDRAQERLDRFRMESASAHLGATGGGGGGEGGLLGMVPGGMFGAIASLGTALAPGIGGAAMGLGLLGGTGFLGLSGIGGAVSAAHQASLNLGITPQQQALTNFSNSVAQRQAQDQVGQAHVQAAQDAITSANSIEQAQQNLAGVQRSSAESQIQALQSVTQAEQGVEQANYSLSEAQYNLNQAWENAQENIRQLNDQLADSKLSVQSAQLAIQQALYNQRLTDQNAYSTSIQRQQAALAVAQAQQQLTDAQDQLTASQYKANLANQEGVNGSQQVIQAKQAVTQAQYQQQDAQTQYANANRQLTLTQLNNTQQVEQAQRQLAMAQEQAAYQRQQDAHATAVAEQNLVNTIQEQRLQWAATMASSNQAANEFQKDMSRLTPAARAVVEQILGLSGAFVQLQHVAEDAIAPGLSVFLTGLSTLMPEITSGVGRMGQVVSQAFGSIGKAMASPEGAKVLDGLINNGIRFAQIVIPAVGRFVDALAEVGSKQGAVDGIANLIGGIANGLTSLVTAVSPFTGSLSSLFSTLGQALSPIGSLLGGVVGQLASALAPVLQQLLPPFSKLVGALAQGLSPVLGAVGPLLTPVVTAFSDIVTAIAPLLPVLGSLVGQLAQALAPILQALTPIIQQVAGLLAKELQQGLTQTLTALLPLFPPLAQLIQSLMPIIGVVLQLTGVILGLVAKMDGELTQAIVWVVAHLLELLSHWQDVVSGIESAADWLWHHVFEPLWSGLSQGVDGFVSDFGRGWGKLQDVLKGPVNFMINTVYTGGIEKFWNDIVTALGQDSLKLPDVQGLATGGVLPGYAPGQDTVPAMLSPGEGVLVPEAVRALGPGTVLALNSMYGGARVSTPGHFSGGGLISDITGGASDVWNTVTGAASKGLDMAKLVAAVATGDTSGLNSALGKLIGTDAAGNFAKMMLGIPTTLVKDAIGAIGSVFGGGGNSPLPTGSSSAVGDLPANWQAIASFLAGNGFTRYAAAGVAGNIMAESGGNPEILEIGGGGGGGLIQWTPYPRSYITGDEQADLMTQLNAILSWGGGPGLVNQATSASNAAQIYQDEYERPASLTASLPQRMASANAVYKAMGWGAYDEGGLAYGVGALPKYTPLPERVLSPRQTEAFERLVAVLDRQPAIDGGSAAGKQVVINFHGTTYPNAEQMAAIKREMALALG
jgi:phage-related protein